MFRSNRNGDGVLKENTARPDIRQSERVMPRVLIGSGMPSKCFRIVSGIERCLRKEFVTVFAWFASQWPVPGKKSPGVYEKSF